MQLNTENVVETFEGSKLGWIRTARRVVRAFAARMLVSEEVETLLPTSRLTLIEVVESESPPLRLRLGVLDDLDHLGADVSIRVHPGLGTGSSVTVEMIWPRSASAVEFHRFLRCAERTATVVRAAERILGEVSRCTG